MLMERRSQVGIEGIENLTGNVEDDFDQSDVDSKTGDERETFLPVCEEWWKGPRVEADAGVCNHVCILKLNHEPPCQCNCGAVRPLEDND